MSSSAAGWSCETLKDGYNAVLTEEEQALAEQEKLIMEELKDRGLIPEIPNQQASKRKNWRITHGFPRGFLQPTSCRNWKHVQLPKPVMTRLPSAEESSS